MAFIAADASGLATLYRRRLNVTTRLIPGLIGLMVTPVLWILVIAPSLDTALGGFNPKVDYFTFVCLSQVAFIVPFTSMFSGINLIVDKEFGILREFLVAPVGRSSITLGNALGVLTVALVQVGLMLGLAIARGAEFHTSAGGVVWFLAAVSLLSLSTYAIAEILALVVARQEAYGPLIPAVGVTPWFLSGSLFPLSFLPDGVRQVSVILPQTHSLALMRYGMMENIDPGLHDVWHMSSDTGMAVLSLLVLVAVTVALLVADTRLFTKKTSA
jgi:ABC-2 type transport system permease protein